MVLTFNFQRKYLVHFHLALFLTAKFGIFKKKKGGEEREMEEMRERG
jgi:hypothetical protein